jgi:hypothetical protein
MPEQPSRHALDIIAQAGEHASAAAKLAAEAAELLAAGPLDTAAAFLGMALLENRAALDRTQLDATAWEAIWREAFAAGRAAERAATEDGPGCPGSGPAALDYRRRRPAMTRLGTGQPGC